MKNIFIYTNPENRFDDESATNIKIQIDAALEFGWKLEDILLFTNFEYEYNGVKSVLVPYICCPWDKVSNKIAVIVHLMQNKMLTDELHWYHDVECFQNNPITEEELGLEGLDLGLTTYGYKIWRDEPYWNGGSFFFRLSAQDIFELWVSRMSVRDRHRTDEKTLVVMTHEGLIDTKRYKELNITYNFGQRAPRLCYDKAIKPIRVVHFHPFFRYSKIVERNIDIFMYGKNEQGVPMMSPKLIELFQKHGYT